MRKPAQDGPAGVADRTDAAADGPDIGMDIPRDEPRRNWRKYLLWGGVVAVVAGAAVAVSSLGPATPTVERESVRVGTVERGDFWRVARGPGSLIPEQVVHVAALAGGRVEKVHAGPGEEVAEGALLVELSNPDVELAALRAQEQLTVTRASLVDLRLRLEDRILDQRAQVAEARVAYRDARREARSDSILLEQGVIARNRAAKSRDRREAAADKLESVSEQLQLTERNVERQIQIQEDRIDRLESILEHERRRVESMSVTAPSGGVLQDLDLEVGQWVQAGQTLARIARPGELRAEVRIPQSRARDLRIGQDAVVDLRGDTVPARVRRVDPNVENGSVVTELSLEGPLPEGARANLSVDGTVRIERVENALHVDRPAYGQSGATVGLFRLVEGEGVAVRTPVRLGRSSDKLVEVVEGLSEGDRVILSDMSRLDDTDRVQVR